MDYKVLNAATLINDAAAGEAVIHCFNVPAEPRLTCVVAWASGTVSLQFPFVSMMDYGLKAHYS